MRRLQKNADKIPTQGSRYGFGWIEECAYTFKHHLSHSHSQALSHHAIKVVLQNVDANSNQSRATENNADGPHFFPDVIFVGVVEGNQHLADGESEERGLHSGEDCSDTTDDGVRPFRGIEFEQPPQRGLNSLP